uniref:Uncharacterized protein n=1 Tax=Pipistrellus kuhlii TaxID=59472 RepID=A0A7J7WDG8_PIPKU|nr:hypothetical protein mPipKuh1_008044 [Pipistrellus kuhlii]
MALSYPSVHCPPGYHLLFLTYLSMGLSRMQPKSWLSCPNILRQTESNSLIDTGLHRACPWEWGSWPVRTFSPTQNSDLKNVTHICDQQTCLYLKIKRKTDNSLCKMHEHASKCPLLKSFIKQKRYRPALTPFVLANFWS